MEEQKVKQDTHFHSTSICLVMLLYQYSASALQMPRMMRIKSTTATFERRRPILLPTNVRRRLPSALLRVHSSQLAPPLRLLLPPRQEQGSLVQRTFTEEQTHWRTVITSLVRMRSIGSSPKSTKSMLFSLLFHFMSGADLEYSIGKKKRAKKDDEDGEVNYINERNKVFNKKISRYFDKYTKEYVFYNPPFECHLHVYAKCGILGSEQTLRGELLFETVIKSATKLFSSCETCDPYLALEMYYCIIRCSHLFMHDKGYLQHSLLSYGVIKSSIHCRSLPISKCYLSSVFMHDPSCTSF